MSGTTASAVDLSSVSTILAVAVAVIIVILTAWVTRSSRNWRKSCALKENQAAQENSSVQTPQNGQNTTDGLVASAIGAVAMEEASRHVILSTPLDRKTVSEGSSPTLPSVAGRLGPEESQVRRAIGIVE